MELALADRDRAAEVLRVFWIWYKLNSPFLVETLFIYNSFTSSALVAAFIRRALRYYHYHLDHYLYAGVSQIPVKRHKRRICQNPI